MDDLTKLFNQIKDEDFKFFLTEYTKNGFGYLSKHDIDLLVWNIISKKCALIKNKSTFDLANLMKIPESKVKTFQIESHLKYGEKNNDSLQELKEKIKNELIKPEVEGDKIRFLLDDQVLKREIENAIKSSGHVIDYSFNKDIVSIRLSVFLQTFSDDKTLESKLVKAIKDNNKAIKKLHRVTTLKDALKATGTLVAGKTAGKLLEIVIDKLWEYYSSSD